MNRSDAPLSLYAGEKDRETIAVVDIGSNSVRLVLYQPDSRGPSPVFNEKVICGMGRNIATTGVLDADGEEKALFALSRFRLLIEGRNVARTIAVATAAARDAANGPAFVKKASQLLGHPVRVLTGLEEARYAGLGVCYGMPNATGIVADLGGGSLELCRLKDGNLENQDSLLVGPLRLMSVAGDQPDDSRALVRKELKALQWLNSNKAETIFAVGGAWRSLARIHIHQNHYPLHILNHYEIGAHDAKNFSHLVARLGTRTLERIQGISKRRVEALPYGALVLEEFLRISNGSKVVISAFGLREGLLFETLSEAEKQKDLLVAATREIGANGRSDPALGEALFGWTRGLFGQTSPADIRRHRAASFMSDVGWETHPDHRATKAYDDILHFPFPVCDHLDRVFLAATAFHRYAKQGNGTIDSAMLGLIPPETAVEAEMLGKAFRLGHTISGGVIGILSKTHLRRTGNKIVLSLPEEMEDLLGDAVEKRLGALCQAAQCASEIDIIPNLPSPARSTG